MNKALTLLLLTSATAQAQYFSGPNEAREPRSAEGFALTRAVCESRVWLGTLSGCTVQVEADPRASLPTATVHLRGSDARMGFFLARVLYGSFSRPNTQEVLAQFCNEGVSCGTDAVLLRRQGTGWKALGMVRGFDVGTCLTFPAKGGTDVALCRAGAGGQQPGVEFRLARWTNGKASVERLATFNYLGYSPPDSAQCRGGWEVQPILWHDRDHNADGRPDLTLAVMLTRYPLDAKTCTMERGDVARSSGRVDLVYHWSGQTMSPTPATRQFVGQYGEKP